jgi:lysophospholipase L1-like esterase
MAGTDKQTARARLPLGRKIAFSLLTLLLVFGLPELLLRLCWSPAQQPVVGSRKFVEWLSQLSLGTESPLQLYEDDPDRLWRLTPGVAVESFNPHYDPQSGERQAIRISINAEGYRGPLVQPHLSGTLRVLCMGDSNFFGYPLDDEDTFPSVLQRTLRRDLKSDQVEVVNGGIPGYTVLQGERWFREQFARYDFDWLLLSYVNNDAWPQPQRDADLLARRAVTPRWLSSLGNSLYLVLWAQSWRQPAELVPRLTLAEFAEHYTTLIEAAKKKNAQVLIVDYRAYEAYEDYSKVLQRLAEEYGVGYFPVGERAAAALRDPAALKPYEKQFERVQRRWGTMLAGREYLHLFAEVSPEHLNEAGAAWLADQLSPILLTQRK